MGFLKWFGYFKFLALFLHLCTHLDLFTQTLVYEISHFNFSLFFFFQAMDFMDTLFIDSLGFFFLSNLNNDCFSVCGGATVREAAVATSEASLLSSFCGTHASSMSLMCFFFCFVFFSVLRLTSSRRPCDSSLFSSGAIRGGFEAFWKIEAHLLYLFFFCFVFSFLK